MAKKVNLKESLSIEGSSVKQHEEVVTAEFSPQPERSIPEAMMQLTKDFDWEFFRKNNSDGLKDNKNEQPNSIIVRVIDASKAVIPFDNAYGWFHKNLSASICSGLIDDFYSVTTDEDRLNIAEKYVTEVLRLTDIEDGVYFRNGVWRRELSNDMSYKKHRDHSIHTLNNYLLGWYFFVNSPRITSSFQEILKRRSSEDSRYCGSLIYRFGEMWCFVSLLHDIGYIFEGELYPGEVDILDSRVKSGASYAKRYFTDVFWKELKIRNSDLKKTAIDMAHLDPDLGKMVLDSPETIVDFLRSIGSLESMGKAIKEELDGSFSVNLPSDGLELWALHFEQFGQVEMAERIRGIERSLYSLIEEGIPEVGVHNLDHGICGALLLLKFSTIWFQLIFSCKNIRQKPKTLEENVCRELKRVTDNWRGYYAVHWWRDILWATGATAIHNVQQSPEIPGWHSLLDYNEAPLAYLGVLVDILQEWDRPSSDRLRTVEGKTLRISSNDVKISVTHDHIIKIIYGCRDEDIEDRNTKLCKGLDKALSNWRDIVEISFEKI